VDKYEFATMLSHVKIEELRAQPDFDLGRSKFKFFLGEIKI
jgi:hypothetical protein